MTVTGAQSALEWHDPQPEELNSLYYVPMILTLQDVPELAQVGVLSEDLLVNGPIPALLNMFQLWRGGDLREIAHAHELSLSRKANLRSLLDRLDSHLCGRCCPSIIVVFRKLQRRRTDDQVQRRLKVYEEVDLSANHSYMKVTSEEIRRSIIKEWQATLTTESFTMSVCGPCGRRTPSAELTAVSHMDFDLGLLRNDALPFNVRPTTYDFEMYHEALFSPKGLTNPWELGPVLMCECCRRELVVKKRMPRLCLANWLYYAHDELPNDVRTAFREATFVDKLLVARARSSRISFRFSEVRGTPRTNNGTDVGSHEVPGSNPALSQRFIKGNVLVMPQNSTHLNEVLPPPADVIRDTVCAVFVGRSKPTKETIGKLGPLLARKSRVASIIRFITCENPHYACDTDFHGFSQRNLDSLFGDEQSESDEGIVCSMELGYIEDNDAIQASVSDYTERGAMDAAPDPSDGLLMENVGYTIGDDSPVSYRDMKMKALSHCLSGGRFIRSQAGDRFIPDFENPSLLTWLFPHLDPWGLGGFHEPSREVAIGMEEQLKYLLELDDSPFERDPDFAFVYYNILQKKQVCDSVRFKVKVSQQADIVRQLLSTDKRELESLIARFKANSTYEPQTAEQHRLVSLVNRVGMLLHDLPGTSGYKLKMRNEIRALVNFHGTPAFFVTLNPSDVNHPLVRLLSGEDISLEALQEGQELTEWQRMLVVAHNPSACAKFFHVMISTFIRVVLRYGRKTRGLLGKCTAYYATVETQGRGSM